jgi:hypothetical protein
MATKKSAKRASAPAKKQTAKMPSRIYAQVSPLSVGGMSMFDAGSRIDSTNFMNFFSETSLIQRTVSLLTEAGFEVLQATGATINIAGSQKTYEEAFSTKLTLEQRTVLKPMVGEDLAEFVECPSTDMPGLIGVKGSRFEGLIEGVAIEEPRYYMASSFAPPRAYWHLSVPAGVSLGCNADKVHRSGITGRGIKVVMADSGWFKHPFFVNRGYRASPVVLGPGAANPLADQSGHGTGESANVFAVAPDVDFTMVKMNFANTKGAFDAAVALSPHIISCSWGSSKPASSPLSAADIALATSISAAVAAGIIVVVSAGNGHWGFPGMHPDVISAGGVHLRPDETLEASDYSSGFLSPHYPGRRCPDLSGLVGMRPRAAYIMLPVEPNDDLDRSSAGGTHPNGDETAQNDGWAAFSGHFGRRSSTCRRRRASQGGLPAPDSRRGARDPDVHRARRHPRQVQPPELQYRRRAWLRHGHGRWPRGRPQGHLDRQSTLPAHHRPHPPHPARTACAARATDSTHPTGATHPTDPTDPAHPARPHHRPDDQSWPGAAGQ